MGYGELALQVALKIRGAKQKQDFEDFEDFEDFDDALKAKGMVLGWKVRMWGSALTSLLSSVIQECACVVLQFIQIRGACVLYVKR